MQSHFSFFSFFQQEKEKACTSRHQYDSRSGKKWFGMHIYLIYVFLVQFLKSGLQYIQQFSFLLLCRRFAFFDSVQRRIRQEMWRQRKTGWREKEVPGWIRVTHTSYASQCAYDFVVLIWNQSMTGNQLHFASCIFCRTLQNCTGAVFVSAINFTFLA